MVIPDLVAAARDPYSDTSDNAVRTLVAWIEGMSDTDAFQAIQAGGQERILRLASSY